MADNFMMFAGQSYLSVIMAHLYLLVMISCLSANFVGVKRGRPSSEIVRWLCFAALFAALFASRAFGIEEGWRTALRGAMYADGTYEMRREFQRPVAAFLLAMGAMLAFALAYRVAHQRFPDRAKLATDLAGLSALALLLLVAFRIVSLSPVDRLLYGPVKLNWIIDVSSSLIIAGAALAYLRILLVRK